MLQLGKTTFGLGLKQPLSPTTVCQDNKKEDITTCIIVIIAVIIVTHFSCLRFYRVVPLSWLLCPFPVTTLDSLLLDTNFSQLVVYFPAPGPRIREAKRTKIEGELTDRNDKSRSCFYPCSESGIKYKLEEVGLKLLVNIFY